MPVLEEMLPRDLLQYCQNHGLLDSILSSSGDSYASYPSNYQGPPGATYGGGASFSSEQQYPPAARGGSEGYY